MTVTVYANNKCIEEMRLKMKQKLLIVFITILFLVTLVSCDNEIKTTDANPVIDKGTGDKTLNENSDDTDTINNETNEDITNADLSSTENITPTPIETAEVANEPIVLSEPPTKYFSSDKVKGEKSEAIPLELIQSTKNNIIDEEEWFLNNNLNLNTFYVEGSFQRGEQELANEIDKLWGEFTITSVHGDESYIYAIYGADYSEGYLLNIYDAHSLKKLYSLDFSNYRYSPEYIPEDYVFIQQKINWAVLRDNILYVSNSHNTYAKSSNYVNGYITAIDLTDYSILWRTQSLVSNANNFEVIDDVIICGYGFTDEKDFLYEIDINTGKVIKEITLKSAPTYIIKKNNTLYIRTYNTDYEFLIGE